jgi:biotin carboxylase
MPRVLILSTTTGYQLRSFGDAAGELGIDLVFATDRCHSLEDPWRDGAIAVRFHEEDASIAAVTTAARERPIDGVLAVGDRPVVLAARVASALGLPGNAPDAALASAHKRLTRERLGRAGLPVPWVLAASLDEGVERLIASVRYPAVIKPVALSGSRGVIRVDTPLDLGAAYQRLVRLMSRPEIRAQRSGTEREVLIEGFIPGAEYAVEGVLTRGGLHALALFEKPDPLDGPFFEETIYVTRDFRPTTACDGSTIAKSRDAPHNRGRVGGTEHAVRTRESVSAGGWTDDRAQRILEAVERAARALGLSHGPVHAECRVNPHGVYVLEVAGRPIGGLCSRVLRFTTRRDGPSSLPGPAHGWSLEHVLLRHAIGEDISAFERENLAAAVMMIPIPRRGVLKSVRGEDQARSVRFVEDVRITAKSDQLLEPLPEAGSYLGFVFARAPHATDAEAAVRMAHRALTFVIDPAIDVVRR